MGATVPEWLLTAVIAVTVFTVMFGIGLSVAPGELRRVWQAPGPMLRGLFSVLLVVAVVLVLAELWQPLANAGAPTIAAMVLTTAAALAAGHLLGGPAPATRTAVAMISAARNPGLALLVATVNAASPAIIATVLAYVLISLLAITPYAVWRHRAATRAAAYR